MRRLRRLSQNLSRQFDSVGLEQVYQQNYLSLAEQTSWLQDVPVASAKGGTANYSLLYALLSLLRGNGFTNVLEIGVGASTKVVTQWANSNEGSSTHIDHDEEWLSRSARDDKRASWIHADLIPKKVAGHSIRWYDLEPPAERFDLVLVDGPPAWNKENRFYRLGFLDWISEVLSDEFVILIDDASRPGEAKLNRLCADRLRESGIQFGESSLHGADSQAIIASPGFRSALFL